MTCKSILFVSCVILFSSVFCIALDTLPLCNLVNYDELYQQFVTILGDQDTALRMVDAWAKSPSGILSGNLYDLGHFDQCYSIKSGQIFGKYCLGTVYYSNEAQLLLPNKNEADDLGPYPKLESQIGFSANLRLGACVPSNWSATEIPGSAVYTEDFCYSKATARKLTTGAIVTIIILSIFGTIIVASTVYDVYLHYSKKKSHHELLISFSYLSNGQKLFRSTTNPDQLLCINGIKALSMMWVVLIHTFYNASSAPFYNSFDFQRWQKDAANMFLIAGPMSVDTFLTVGGIVTTYTFLKARDKGAKFNIGLYYVHRYLRLTPAFLIVILFHLFLVNYFGIGPLWQYVDKQLVEPCEKNWYSSVLYIGNYVQRGNCISPSWYLNVDMQLYILSPIVLIPLWKKPRFGAVLLGILCILGCIVPFIVAHVEKFGSISIGIKLYTYYYQTYTRFGPYVIGMTLGYFIYKIKKSELKIELKPFVVALLWIISLVGLVACIYGGYPLEIKTEEDVWGVSLHLAFDRQLWSVALCLLIFLCVTGYGGPIDGLLSLPAFQILTKLSYSTYLIHYSVITMRYLAMKTSFKYSNPAVMHFFLGDFMVTLALSLILCLSFELPILILEKYLFGGCSIRRKAGNKKVTT